LGFEEDTARGSRLGVYRGSHEPDGRQRSFTPVRLGGRTSHPQSANPSPQPRLLASRFFLTSSHNPGGRYTAPRSARNAPRGHPTRSKVSELEAREPLLRASTVAMNEPEQIPGDRSSAVRVPAGRGAPFSDVLRSGSALERRPQRGAPVLTDWATDAVPAVALGRVRAFGAGTARADRRSVRALRLGCHSWRRRRVQMDRGSPSV
jgi:hypothetical protein